MSLLTRRWIHKLKDTTLFSSQLVSLGKMTLLGSSGSKCISTTCVTLNTSNSESTDDQPFHFPSLPRDTEISILTNKLFSADFKLNCQVNGLFGVKGIGKSTLVHQLLAFAATSTRPVSKDRSALKKLETAVERSENSNNETSTSSSPSSSSTSNEIYERTLPKPPITHPSPNESRYTVAYDFDWVSTSFDQFITNFETILLSNVLAAISKNNKSAVLSPAQLFSQANKVVSIEYLLNPLLNALLAQSKSPMKVSIDQLSIDQKLFTSGKLLSQFIATSQHNTSNTELSDPILRFVKELQLGQPSSPVFSQLKQNPAFVTIYLMVIFADQQATQRKQQQQQQQHINSDSNLPKRSGILSLKYLLGILNTVNNFNDSRVLFLFLNASPYPNWIKQTANPKVTVQYFSVYYDNIQSIFKKWSDSNTCPPTIFEFDDGNFFRDLTMKKADKSWIDMFVLPEFESIIGDDYFIPNAIFPEPFWNEIYSYLGGHPASLSLLIKNYWSSINQAVSWENFIPPTSYISIATVATRQFISDEIDKFMKTDLKQLHKVYKLEKAIYELNLNERLKRSRLPPTKATTLASIAPSPSTSTSSYSAFLEMYLRPDVAESVLTDFEKNGLSIQEEIVFVDVLTRFCETTNICALNLKGTVFYEHPVALALVSMGYITFTDERTIVFSSLVARKVLEGYCARFLEQLPLSYQPLWMFTRHFSGILSMKTLERTMDREEQED